MKDHHVAYLAGAVAIVIGLLVMFGLTTTAYGASERSSLSTNAPRPGMPTEEEVSASAVNFSDLSNESQRQVVKMANGTLYRNTTPEVMRGVDDRAVLVSDVNATNTNASANVSAGDYVVQKKTVPLTPAVFGSGALLAFGGVLSIYYGTSLRRISKIDEKIAELENSS